jgi:hypothetical protein
MAPPAEGATCYSSVVFRPSERQALVPQKQLKESSEGMEKQIQ